jgi:restriction system protein
MHDSERDPIPPPRRNQQRPALSGKEFEQLVTGWLRECGASLPDFRVESQELITAPDGNYRIDVSVHFSQLGMDFFVLGECKDHSRAVEREDVQVLNDKIRAVGAHKGVLFSTNGFQRGAIEYARAHGIALVQVANGDSTYVVREINPKYDAPPPWANVPPFVGQLVWLSDDGLIHRSLVESSRVDALTNFLLG